jgi:chaperonin GroES
VSELVRPLGSRVLVRVEQEENVTSSGLYVPDTAREKPQRGVVVAVGDDSDVIKVAAGDRILFPKFTGTEIRIEAVDHLIIESADLLPVLQTASSASVAA